MARGWYAELEHEHAEHLLLLEVIEVAIEAGNLEEARDAVAKLDRQIVQHLAFEEELFRGRLDRRMLPEELAAFEALEREHAGLLPGMTSLRYAVRGVIPAEELARALAFVRAFRRHTLEEQRLLRAVYERLERLEATARLGESSFSRTGLRSS